DQVRDVLRKTLRSGEGGATAIEQDNSSSRPNWAALKVPVNVTIRSASGSAGVFRAQTVFASRRGVKLISSEIAKLTQPCPIKPRQTLWIEVPSTGRAAGGEVIWTGGRPNRDGNVEFAVEIDSPDLFEVFASPVEEPNSGAGDTTAEFPLAQTFLPEEPIMS